MAIIDLPPQPHGSSFDSAHWQDWLFKVRERLTKAGQIIWSSLDFTGSKLTDIATRNYDDLQNRPTIATNSPLTGGGILTNATGLSLSIPASTGSVNGYLSAADWTTFSGKENVLTFSTPLSRATNTISIPAATGSVNGYLNSTDWTAFNNKATISKTVTNQTALRALNTTYTNSGLGTLMVLSTFRCAITLAAGNAYAQGKSDSSTPPTTVVSGIVGIQSGLLNEDNTFQVAFLVGAGLNYRLDSSSTNGTCTLGNWFEMAF